MPLLEINVDTTSSEFLSLLEDILFAFTHVCEQFDPFAEIGSALVSNIQRADSPDGVVARPLMKEMLDAVEQNFNLLKTFTEG